MEYNILYISIFLDKKSQSNLKKWFILTEKQDLLKKECADMAVMSIVKDRVDSSFLTDKYIGEKVDLKVIGIMNDKDVQIALCSVSPSSKLKSKVVKIVVSSNLSKINLSKYKDEDFKEKDGPSLTGTVGFLTKDRESVLEIKDVYKNL